MKLSAILTVARRELRAFFDQPTGYILAVVFIGVNDFLFFRSAYLLGSASLRPMFDLLPWLLLFLVPAVTMRSLAEDSRSGTIEIVLSQPLTELEYLLGKYLGQVGFLWLILALTLPIPILFSLGADLHVGVVLAQYVGACLLTAGLAAVGVWSSSMTKNQITAFILGVAVMFLLILLGLDQSLTGLPPVLAAGAARLAVLSHFQDIGRGVIDLRDVVYFLTLSAAFLALAYQAILRSRLSVGGEPRRRLAVGTVLVVAVAVLLNLFGRHISGRLDLTPGGAYTLSDATGEIIRGAEDIITVKLYASSELPQQFSLIRRDIDDLLSDYERASGGNVRVIEADPAEDSLAAEEVRTLGIPPVQFNVVETSQFTVREGYLGMSIQYADQSEVIPFIGQADDLEYRVTTAIRGMIDPTRPTVGLYVSPLEAQLGASYNALRGALSGNFDLRTLDLETTPAFGTDLDVVILLGTPDSIADSVVPELEAFLDRGGSLMVAARGMSLEQNFGVPSTVPWNTAIERFGVQIGGNLVYDLGSHESISRQTTLGFPVLQPYPYWARGLSTRLVPVNAGIETVVLPWTSTVDVQPGADESTITPLLVTSEGAGIDSQLAMLDPDREFPETDLGTRTLAVIVNPLVSESVADGAEPEGARAAVFGTPQHLSDDFAQSGPAPLGIALNLVDWLAQDDALVSIRSKNRTPPTLNYEGEATGAAVKWINVVGVPLGLVAYAILRLFRRRERSRRPYVGPNMEAAL